MLGILVWYDPRRQSGIVWCEDQGALASLSRPEGCDPAELAEGELLEIEVRTEGSVRRVVRILARRGSCDAGRLRRLLRGAAGGGGGAGGGDVPLRGVA